MHSNLVISWNRDNKTGKKLHPLSSLVILRAKLTAPQTLEYDSAVMIRGI